MAKKQLGQLPPQYDFFLNPYDDLRFTLCPKCGAKTGQRKIPLVIWVDPHYPVSLNYTCRYCKDCDLLIAHQNEIEKLLAQLFRERNPQIIGNEYTVLGTMEKTAWKQGVQKPIEFQEMPAHLHEFNQVLKFEMAGYLPDQEQEQVCVRLPHDAENKDSPANKGVSPSSLLIDNLPKAMALLEKMKLAPQHKGRRYGLEVKFNEAPSLTPSMRIAVSELNLERRWIVYPGNHVYPVTDKITALPLAKSETIQD